MFHKINFAFFCSSFNFSNQLLNLLLYACGNVDDTQNCRLNFREAVRANNNQPSLNLLSSYSSQYFAETEYNDCIDMINVSFSTIHIRLLIYYFSDVNSTSKCILRDRILQLCSVFAKNQLGKISQYLIFLEYKIDIIHSVMQSELVAKKSYVGRKNHRK